MKLVAAIIVTGVTLTIAVAGYDLIAMNARVVLKYERTAMVNTLRFRIKEQLACRASMKTVCEDGNAELAFTTPLEGRDKFRFVQGKNLSYLMGSRGLKTVLSTSCTATGKLNLDYVVVRDGKPVNDPVSRKPTTWRSLYGGPVCFLGTRTIHWP